MRARSPRSTIWPTLFCLLLAAAADGVIIDSGDGTGNTTAPTPADPGWAYVGTRGELSAIYLGDGWVLTANHVGAGDVVFGGTPYPYLPGSAIQLETQSMMGLLPSDLLLFQIGPYPALATPAIADTTPALDDELILIGHGLNRGPATSWDENGEDPPEPVDGYEWAVGWTLRWGTNHAEDFPPEPVLGTWAFGSYFDAGGSAHEAQAAHGDSGGAVFAFDGSAWELAGVMFVVSEYEGQPMDESFYGQGTYAADLSQYRDDILDIVALPEPAGGLAAGVAFLSALAHRRARRRARPPRD